MVHPCYCACTVDLFSSVPGSVVAARTDETAEKVVIKVECGTLRTLNEKAAYNALEGVPGIPRCHQAATIQSHGIIVLDRLGDNLYTYLESFQQFLPIEEIYVLGRALVKILQDIHGQGVIHRDIKPDNILLPLNRELQPYLVDFGHAKLYCDATGKHKPISGERAHGMLPFMSLNVHSEIRYSRRDDIVSLAYTLIYLAHGSLPWYRLSAIQCKRMKPGFRLSDLTPPLPVALGSFLDYATNLR
ncbi:kinase-like domain-containing protein [Suillus plorans]|uniref:non-specific serine/threonine protein kinase n=1 Tax=Suillus plorans TaxID=116603 RepID=A0A9P7AAT8_9AGAM|nr:kinase-like domain-containing protein [Suillus plorans]KAG1785680.1 kinase-like domain-containing protein [Suillus plorans]